MTGTSESLSPQGSDGVIRVSNRFQLDAKSPLRGSIARDFAPRPRSTAVVIEKLMSWFVFWTIRVLYLYNAIFHIFFGEMAARFIGWADSPFQFEVGAASLGFSAVGFWLLLGPSTAASRRFSAPASSCWAPQDVVAKDRRAQPDWAVVHRELRRSE
jgi:hypothetical protein